MGPPLKKVQTHWQVQKMATFNFMWNHPWSSLVLTKLSFISGVSSKLLVWGYKGPSGISESKFTLSNQMFSTYFRSWWLELQYQHIWRATDNWNLTYRVDCDLIYYIRSSMEAFHWSHSPFNIKRGNCPWEMVPDLLKCVLDRTAWHSHAREILSYLAL